MERGERMEIVFGQGGAGHDKSKNLLRVAH